MPITLTDEEVKLLVLVMDNADVYITDDSAYEMEQDMEAEGLTTYAEDVRAIYSKLKGN